MANLIGPVFWNEENNYVTQDNNPSESFLGKLKINVPGVQPLQSCGPSTGTICSGIILGKKGYDQLVPKVRGSYKPQPEEMLMDFFQDGRFLKDFLNIRDNYNWKATPFNEVPQYYPFAVRMVFEIEAEFTWKSSFKDVINYLENGWPVQICLKKPGHYMAIVAYDSEKNEFRYHDPWKGRHSDNTGFNKRMPKAEFERNVKPFVIVYKSDLKKVRL